MIRKDALIKFKNEYQDKPVWTIPEVSRILGVPLVTMYAHLGKVIFAHAQKIGRTNILTRPQVLAYLEGGDVPEPEVKLIGTAEAAQHLGISRRWIDMCLSNGRLSAWEVKDKGGTLKVFAPHHLVLKPYSKYAKVLVQVDKNHVIFVGDETGRIYNKAAAQRRARDLGLV